MSHGKAVGTAFVLRSIRGLFAVSLLILFLNVPSVSSPQDSAFTFAIAGDFGANSNTATVLSGMGEGTDFSIADGDFSYGELGTQPIDHITPSPWCSHVAGKIPGAGQTYPFQLITGNHEVDKSGPSDPYLTHGHIDNFARCLPNLISTSAGSGLCLNRDPSLGAGGCYGVEYYFDYPETNPIARFILVYGSSSDTIDGVNYRFSSGNVHYNWVSSVIDQAKASGLWTIAAVHMPCLTMGISGCSQSRLQQLFASKRVDLVVNGHDHNYQRSKQLTGFNATSYDPSYVVDDGSDNFYLKGQGTVYTIVGTGGATLFDFPPSNTLAPYFARWNDTTHGFLKVSLSQTTLMAEFVRTAGGTFQDAFAIDESPRLFTRFTSAPVTPVVGGPVSFQAQVLGGTAPYTFIWNFGDGASGVGISTSHIFASAGRFNVTLTMDDSGGLTAMSSELLAVALQVTFGPTDDAFVRQDTPSSNHGSASTLDVDNDPVKNILLRFDVQVSGEVLEASLRLYQVDASSRGGDFHTASGDWTESTVTWNNAPSANPLVFFSLGQVLSNSWYDVDLTSVVIGNGAISLRVTSPSTDGSQFSSKEGPNPPQLVVYVLPNSAPSLQLPSVPHISEESTLTFTVVATDDPSQMIVVDVTGLPIGATFTSTPATGSATGTLAWTPTEIDGPGAYLVTFRATDILGAQTTGDVVISVQEVNEAPVATVPGNQSAWGGITLTFFVTATDPDVPLNNLTLSVSGLTTNMQFDPTTGLFAFTPDSSQTNATFALTFTVVDGGNPSLSDSKTVWISVLAASGGGGGHYVT